MGAKEKWTNRSDPLERNKGLTMSMDCKKCHHICQASCCAAFPIEKSLFERNKHKVVREILQMEEFESPVMEDKAFRKDGSYSMEGICHAKNALHVLPITKNARCCFLNEDLSCNIYEERPYICRKFGDESHPMMTCCFQSKDGRIRSRQEQRAVCRKVEKHQNKLKIIINDANHN